MLSDGRSVVLEASFSQGRNRWAAADLGTKMGARVVFAECRCPSDVALERLADRWRARTQTLPDRKASGGASDGRPELFQAQLAAWQPVASEEARRLHLIEVPTTLSPEESSRASAPGDGHCGWNNWKACQLHHSVAVGSELDVSHARFRRRQRNLTMRRESQLALCVWW